MKQVDADRVIAYLRDKWGGRPCPMCVVGNWNVQAAVFELRQFNGGALILGGPIIPVIPVSCTNCGNTVLVNAISAGILEREPAAAVAPPPDKVAQEAKK